jgi:L-arabinokinase
VACGEADQLLALLCQPAEIRKPVPIPKDVRFWGIDSGIRHAVSGADYTSVRVGAFMGYRILADLAGLPVRPGQHDGHLQIDDATWGGYLANVSPSQFEQRFARQLPERMKGRDFLAKFEGTTDPVTIVEPDRTYGVRQPAAHPVQEHFRVRCFAAHFQAPLEEIALKLLGELMYQSHASYSACGLGSDGTDLLVELVEAAGPDAGLYGAKITGGGCGGTVVVLGRTGAEASVGRVIEEYRDQTGRNPVLFKGSSPGAAACGLVRLRFDSGVWSGEALGA